MLLEQQKYKNISPETTGFKILLVGAMIYIMGCILLPISLRLWLLWVELSIRQLLMVKLLTMRNIGIKVHSLVLEHL